MADFSNSFEVTVQPLVVTAVHGKGSEAEIPYVVLDGGPEIQTNLASAIDVRSAAVPEEITSCCPLADFVNGLKQILQSLPALGGRPPKPALLMERLYGLVEQIDQAYANLERSHKAEMARLQLPMIDESKERQLLISSLKDIVGIEDFDPLMGLLLGDSCVGQDFEIIETVISSHPEVALIVECLANHQQPISVRFQQLQKQLNHASKHRVKERKEVADALQLCGLARMSRKMRNEALSIEMGSCG